MAQTNEHMARGNELMREVREAISRFGAEARADREQARIDRERSDERWREEIQITREFMRRNEVAFQESRDALQHVLGRMDAQTKALFAILDKLDGGAATGTA